MYIYLSRNDNKIKKLKILYIEVRLDMGSYRLVYAQDC